MIGWMCGMSAEDEVRSDLLLKKLSLDDIELLLQTMLGWPNRVQRGSLTNRSVRRRLRTAKEKDSP